MPLVKRLFRTGSSQGVVIDLPLLRLLGWQQDERVELCAEDGCIVVKKAPLADNAPLTLTDEDCRWLESAMELVLWETGDGNYSWIGVNDHDAAVAWLKGLLARVKAKGVRHELPGRE